MKKILLLVSALLLWSGQGWAVPVLQIGVSDGVGGYVGYETIGADDDTAFTNGYKLLVAGAYQKDDILQLGGQYTGTYIGKDWSDFGLPEAFNTHGAVLIATVNNAEITGTSEIKVDGASHFFFSSTDSYYPNRHYPLNAEGSAFYFFDLGNFVRVQDFTVPNFETGDASSWAGEIKELIVSITGFSSVHFDVMAVKTIGKFNNKSGLLTAFKSTALENNPGSHDVTWKFEEGDGGGGQSYPVVPEPGTFILVGAGLVGLALLRRKQGR